jgi:hypothetical protein
MAEPVPAASDVSAGTLSGGDAAEDPYPERHS